MPIRSKTTGQRLAVLVVLQLIIGCGPGGDGSSPAPAINDTSPSPGDPASNQLNRAPIALPDSMAASGAPANLQVLLNDSDPDGDVIRLSGVSTPMHGTALIMDNGTADFGDDYIRYTPNPGYSGSDRFSYSIFDGLNGSASGDVFLVAPVFVPGAPIMATDDYGSTEAGIGKNLSVLDNDFGGNGSPLQIVAVSSAGHGSVIIADNGTAGNPADDFIVYYPVPGYTGPDSLTYSVTDGESTATAAININIMAPAPVVSPSNPALPPPPAPAPVGLIGGRVLKGPVAGATVKLFALDATGWPVTSTPMAQTVTDLSGNWSMPDPLPGQHRLVVASAGSYIDEAHSFDNPQTIRSVSLPDSDVLSGVMPADDSYLALTLFSNALLLKSREETNGDDFADVYQNNRLIMTAAYGFDLVTTVPANPLNPDPASSDIAHQYALVAGGGANALKSIGVGIGQSETQIGAIKALVRDLVDCNLNGQGSDGIITVDVSGVAKAIPDDNDLNLEVLRFRNNQFDLFGSTSLPTVDIDVCGSSGALPDAIAPVITGVPAEFNMAASGPGGITIGDSRVQGLLTGVGAVDDRDGAVPVVHDAPASFPTGQTTVSFTASDSGGNTATVVTTVVVIENNAVPTVTPVGVLVSTQDVPFVADLSVYFSDADGDALNYAIAGLPASMAFDMTTGILSGTPGNFDAVLAPFSVTVSASDGVFTVSDSFAFGVVNTNSAPALVASVADSAVSLNVPLTLNLADYFYDDDGDSLTFMLTGLPPSSALVFDPVSGQLTGIPGSADAAASPLVLTITATDGMTSVSDTYSLSVVNNNTAPVVAMPLGARSGNEDTSFFADISDAFDDPDNDVLSFSAAGLPASLNLNPVTGVISGTPDNDDALNSPISVVITASDGALNVSDTLSLIVANTNDSPGLATPIGVQFATQGTPFTLDVSSGFVDIDNDTLTFTATGLPTSLAIGGGGIISGTPDAAATAASPLTVTVTASDGSLSVSDTFSLNVALFNNAPTVTAPIGAQTGMQGTPLTLNAGSAFLDPDGNALGFSVSGLPPGTGLTLDGMSGMLSGIPSNDDVLAGPIVLVVTASDGGLSVSDSFTLTISNVNDPPSVTSAISPPLATQDTFLSFNISATFEDIDNDDLSFSATGLPPGLVLDSVTGTISGTPTNADVLASPLAITVIASDGALSTNSTFALTVVNVNDAPTLIAAIVPPHATQGSPFSLALGSSFNDPDGDSLSYSVTGLPVGSGLVLDPATGFLAGNPTNADALASPSVITVTATDGLVPVNALFTLGVVNVNDAPTVTSPIVPPMATQDAPLSFNVSANFDDIDNDALTFSATSLPASLTLHPTTGVISGTPTNTDVLASPISVTITADDGPESVSTSFALTVANVNDAPALISAIVPPSATQGVLFSLDVSGNFDDIDNDTLTFTATGLPASLSLDPNSGVISGIPSNDDALALPFTITITATDGALPVNGLFSLSVNNVNDTPTVTSPIVPPTATQDAPLSFDVSAYFDDIDNDMLTFSESGLPASLMLNPTTGVISGTPTNAEALASPFAVTVTASDGAESADAPFALNIVNVNDAPTVISAIASQSATQGTPFSLDVTSAFDDIDNDTLVFSIDGLPAATGLGIDSATGVVSGSPSHWDAVDSPYALTVTASDGEFSAVTGFALTVADINEAPYLFAAITATLAYEAVPYEFDVSSSFADPDADVLAYNVSGFPVGTGLIADPATGLITGVPTSSDFSASPMTLTVTVEDPLLESVTENFDIVVEALADVDVTMTTLVPVPVQGNNIQIKVTANNYGPSDASGITITVPLPPGLEHTGSSASKGSYNPASGVWSNITIGNGSNAVLDIDVDVTAAPVAFLSLLSQIVAADQDDPDTNNSDVLDITVIGPGVEAEWLGGDAAGPNDWGNPDNWDTGAVPGNFDEVDIKNGRPSVVLDGSRSVSRIKVESSNTLDLNGQTLTVYGEVDADGPITGSCATSRVRLIAGKLGGILPEVEIAGPAETRADTIVSCNLSITGGRLRLGHHVDVAGDFSVLNTGILWQKDGGKNLRVAGDVLFDGGNHSIPVGGSPPLKAGFLFVGGNFTQRGSPFSFAAEKDHTVVFDGSGPQVVSLSNPDMSSPDEDDPPLMGSRFARLRVDKDTADGVIDFQTDVAILKYIEISDVYSPTLTSTTGSHLFVGGMRIEDTVGVQTESAVFDGLPLNIVVGDNMKELDGVHFINMDPTVPQITIVRPDLKELHDGKSFNNLRFDTFPDVSSGGAYIDATNTNINQTKNLTLKVISSYPLHGEPWTSTAGNFDIIWGLPTDDSDADGLPDSQEFGLGSSPTNPDADGDGLGDGLEFEMGIDPATPELSIVYVDAFAGNDLNDGSSWAEAVKTSAGLVSGPLSAVTGTPQDPVYILFGSGSYGSLMLDNTDHVVAIGSLGPATFYPFAPYDSVIGQGGAYGLRVQDSANVLLRALRLSGASNTTGNGGGLSVGGVSGSSVTLLKSEISGNHSDYNGGGFVVAAGSSLLIEDSLISDNSADGQGSAIGGGGGAVFGGLTMINSVVSNNRVWGSDANDGGGGLLLTNSDPVSITDSLLVANYAVNYGGGALIDSIGAPVLIKNNLVVGNAVENATGAGFEILDIDSGASLFIESNTIYYNQALILEDIAGGLNLANAAFAEIRDNIIHENQDNKLSDRITDNYRDADGTAIVEFNNIGKDPTLGVGGNIKTDPRFVRGFYLDTVSDSINAGSTTATLAGFNPPYTTHEDGDADTGTVDHGFHYKTPAAVEGLKDVVVVSSACYAPGELTMIVRPRTEDPLDNAIKLPMGPGLIVSVEESDLNPTGKIDDESSLVNIKPDGGGTRLAIDEGTGDYRFTVVNVNNISDEVEIDVFVNHAVSPKKVKSPKVDTIPGC